MYDIQHREAREAREALIVVLSTAACMGVDVDLLCHLSVDELMSGELPDDVKPFASGAIYQIATCMSYVLEPRPLHD
jgi:hypothetical protein